MPIAPLRLNYSTYQDAICNLVDQFYSQYNENLDSRPLHGLIENRCDASQNPTNGKVTITSLLVFLYFHKIRRTSHSAALATMPKMRIVIIVSLLIFQFQLAIGQEDGIYISDNELYGNLKNGLPEKDTIVEIKKDGIILGKGAIAISKKYGKSDLRVGYWKEYTENGTLKMEGNYKLSSYIGCGVGGPFRAFNYYRAGLWKIYDNSGELKYELNFEPTELHINTSCEGGDKLLFGIIKEIPLKYSGDLTSDKIFELQKIRNEDEYLTEIWTPLNGQIFIEIKKKHSS